MQLIIWNLWRLGELGVMDSLHVSGGVASSGAAAMGAAPTSGSKGSSRSASPCRPYPPPPGVTTTHQATPPSSAYQPHHVKSLSHGSADSAKGQDVGGVATSSHPAYRPPRHRSPTASSTRTPAEMDDGHAAVSAYDDSMLGVSALDGDASLYCADSSFASNGSVDHDDSSSGALHHSDVDPKTSAVLEHLSNKIVRVRDLIRTEQKLRDDNVNEYLKLAANADKHQVARIKAVFEKKNQKSAHVIAQLQRKLDAYQKRARELEMHGGGGHVHRPPREVLRDMGQGLKNVGGNIRDGITGLGGSVMSKPREFAHLIKNKFGSADNISQLSTWYVGQQGNAGGAAGAAATGLDSDRTPGGNGGTSSSDQGDKHSRGSATLPAQLSAATVGASGGLQQHKQKFPSDEGSECSSVTSISIESKEDIFKKITSYRYGRSQDGTQDNFIETNKKLRSIQEQLDSFREGFDAIKQLRDEIQFLNSALQDEKFRSERLEEQINDLTELHQNEVENLKQAMADMEEKVQYQSEERLRDIHEMLEQCQTKIQKMEHQAQQQQQYVTLEGLDNSNARAVVVKLINVLLTVLQVILLLVATGAGIIMPFLRTRVRIITTVVFVVAIVFTLKQWPEVSDIGSHVMKRLKDMLAPVQ